MYSSSLYLYTFAGKSASPPNSKINGFTESLETLEREYGSGTLPVAIHGVMRIFSFLRHPSQLLLSARKTKYITRLQIARYRDSRIN